MNSPRLTPPRHSRTTEGPGLKALMMPSFFGSLVDAHKAGLRCLPCAHCGGWVWWPPEHELTEATRKAGRVFHTTGKCQEAEQAARKETPMLAHT